LTFEHRYPIILGRYLVAPVKGSLSEVYLFRRVEA
jgi:hypothetical protein